MKIGKYNVSIVKTSNFGLDGGAMFGIVPKALWNGTNPADEKNRIVLTGNLLLLENDSRNILVDTGIGNGWSKKFADIYNVQDNNNNLYDALNNAGKKPDDITDVILTHLHFDHTGGSTITDGSRWVPALPNAKYHVNKEQFEWAKQPLEKDKGSFESDRFVPLMKEGVLEFFEDNENMFDDEIELITTKGHTFGHTMVKVSDSSNTILYCADLLPTTSHIPLPYIMGFDLQPLETLKEKKEILNKAVEEDWLLLFEHDPYYVGAKANKTHFSFEVKEKFDTINENGI